MDRVKPSVTDDTRPCLPEYIDPVAADRLADFASIRIGSAVSFPMRPVRFGGEAVELRE